MKNSFFDTILNLFFEPSCYICGLESHEPICINCIKDFKKVTEKNNDHFHFSPFFDEGLSLYEYEGKAKKAIYVFKIQKKFSISISIASILADAFKSQALKYDFIVHVPGYHVQCYDTNNFNPSLILAKRVSNLLDVKILYNAVYKIKKTEKQALLDLNERLKNLENAFKLNTKFLKTIKDRNILIVDDVFTTGTTINEVSKALSNARPKKIGYLTFARAA